MPVTIPIYLHSFTLVFQLLYLMIAYNAADVLMYNYSVLFYNVAIYKFLLYHILFGGFMSYIIYMTLVVLNGTVFLGKL